MQPRTATLVLLLLFACACAPGQSADVAPPSSLDRDSGIGDDSPTFDASSGDDDADDDASIEAPDASADALAAPPFDAGPNGVCARPLAPGDLAIVEVMIASTAGSGDHGEWLEVRSSRDCALSLRGLHGEGAVGGHVHTFDVIDDVWLAPRGTFVVADSIDPAINHDLPGVVLAWEGNAGDVLRNLGSTVTLRANGAIVDSLTYPALKITVGASVAFPHDCDGGARSDFGSWRTSTRSWFPGFSGTPNAPNVDVHCP